jgi:hypothetical protein
MMLKTGFLYFLACLRSENMESLGAGIEISVYYNNEGRIPTSPTIPW